VLKVSSGLLPSVAIDAFVFLRSAVGGGDSGTLPELFRDSHENGFRNFPGTGAGDTELCFSSAGGAGGGGNLTGDILPDSPWRPVAEFPRGGSFGRRPGDLAFSAHCQIVISARYELTSAKSPPSETRCTGG
jgi:hypothetical protein